VKNAISILNVKKAPPRTKAKLIGMVSKKRERRGKIFLTVEDLEDEVTLLVSTNSAVKNLIDKARHIMLDQVVCFSVVKTKSQLLVVNDIIFPDVAPKRRPKTSSEIYAVLTSDMHVGSTKFQRESFNRFLMWLNGKYGDKKMRETAGYVKYVLIAGDIVDGIGIYPNQINELAIKEINDQYRFAAKFIEQIPDYIEIIIIPGNHDVPRKALPQPPIPQPFLEPLQETRKIHSFGNPCNLSLHDVEVLMFHGRSLDDVISSVPGMSHEHPSKSMTLLLQSRHLAPIYGGKTPLSSEAKDHLVIERVPDIFHAGHIHRLECRRYRGIRVINSGGWQSQTEYMKRHRFFPTYGKIPIVNLQNLETKIVSFN
jgi:DNA polymerase II small subunit